MAAQQIKPPVLQPVPEPPPPPPGYELDPALEPQVTILKRGTDTVEEYRIGGKLYMIKVTPAHGRPYYLVDNRATAPSRARTTTTAASGRRCG